MKPAPPSGSMMYGRRTTNGTSESDGARASQQPTSHNVNHTHNKFATNAEQQWYSMMASKSHADETWAAQEKHIEAPKQPKIISSPHTATQFRVPGARGYAMVPHVVIGSGKGKGKGMNQPPSVMRVARANPVGREVNSKTDAKPVPGQINPLGLVKRPGARPPPPMHPSMLMRKTNGVVTTGGARPPPRADMLKSLQGPHGRGPPPPEVLARLRARGPPNQARMRAQRPSAVAAAQPPPSTNLSPPSNEPPAPNARPSRLAQGGMDVLSSKPLPKVSVVNGAAVVNDSNAIINITATTQPRGDHNDYDGDTSLMSSRHEDEDLGNGWIQMWDDEVKSNYYYNQNTGEASWLRPDDIGQEIVGNRDSVVSSLDGGGSVSIDNVVWDKYWDDEASAYYLHNPLTDETRWEEEEGVNYEADTK